MQNKNIIITGGAGFIGSHLVEKLYKKNKVIVIDNLSNGNFKNIRKFRHKIIFLKSDVEKINSLKLPRKIDVIFHLAALADIVPSIADPKKYFNSNVRELLKY